jgi:SagB-type dehydrogenase family enzyme
MRLRRTRALVTYWRDDKLVLSNYRTGVSCTADPLAVRVLDLFGRWRHPEEIVSALARYQPASVHAAVHQLLQASLLVREGTFDARLDARVEKVWSPWLPYGAFHFGTKDVPFAPEREMYRLVRRALAKSKQPPFFKRYSGVRRLRLPPQVPPKAEFLRVLMARRTHRIFSPANVSLASVSSLLFYTWGVTGYIPTTLLGPLPRKTSPSGGARHPGEVYLVALRVSGLAPGLYHYDLRRHRLERLRKGEMRSKAFQYCAGQSHARNAAALFIMTAVLPRVMWKYPFARAYRVVLLDAGHLCQTFCLTATWLGLAPFCTAALKDSLIERDLGIDGVSEVALYVAGVGMPRKPPRP